MSARNDKGRAWRQLGGYLHLHLLEVGVSFVRCQPTRHVWMCTGRSERNVCRERFVREMYFIHKASIQCEAKMTTTSRSFGM